MTKSIDIGLMMPYSSLYPMGKLFKKGLTEALDAHKDKMDYTLYPEFVGPASIEEVNKADDKHASYNDVDVVTGIVNSKTVAEASVSFKNNTHYRFGNLGEHLEDTKQLGRNIKVEGLDIWKDVYALTDYALKTFSKNGAYAASFYDTGYAFAQMVDVALKDHGKNDFLPVLVSQMPPAGQPSNVEEVVERIERLNPDWVFAAFCGSEALRFLKMWKKKGLYKKIKLLGLTFFAEKLLELDSSDVEVVSVIHQQASQIDIQEYNRNHFYDLGIQVGRGILKEKGINENTNQISKDKMICSFQKLNDLNLQLVEKARVKTIKMNNKHVRNVLKQPMAAWQNPYMCI
ncbi:MAG: ABC transporter substrate-binding protein [Nonlabens sp.]